MRAVCCFAYMFILHVSDNYDDALRRTGLFFQLKKTIQPLHPPTLSQTPAGHVTLHECSLRNYVTLKLRVVFLNR